MDDGEASAARSGLGSMDDAPSGTGKRLAEAWGERLAGDAAAGGEAGEEEEALVQELAAALPHPFDAPVSTSPRALDLARSLGERNGGAGRGALHARFVHLRAVLFADLLEGANLHGEGLRNTIETCLDRADRSIAPLAEAAFEGAEERAAADPLRQRASWTDQLVRRLRHDIKTPLQAASLNLELLALERADDAGDLEAIETIQASIDQAVDMLRPLDRPSDER